MNVTTNEFENTEIVIAKVQYGHLEHSNSTISRVLEEEEES
jgi:hypothetical protein